MPNIVDLILLPFKWAVSAVLWVFHSLFTAIGMDPSSGLTWVLCIICLTLVMPYPYHPPFRSNRLKRCAV